MKMQHYLDDARIVSWICPFGGDPSIKPSWKDVCSIELDEFYLSVYHFQFLVHAVGESSSEKNEKPEFGPEFGV